MRLMVVCGHVTVWRVVTAKGDAAGLAGTQMKPPAVNFDTFFANIFFRGLDVGDCAQMFAQMTILTHILKLRDSGINKTGLGSLPSKAGDLFLQQFTDRRRPGPLLGAPEVGAGFLLLSQLLIKLS
jgi:hypothetical protein